MKRLSLSAALLLLSTPMLKADDLSPSVRAALPGVTWPVPLSMRNADRPDVRDYAPGGIVGNAWDTVLLNSPQSDDHDARIVSSSHLHPGLHVASAGLPVDATITTIAPPQDQSLTLITTSDTIPDAEQTPLAASRGMGTAFTVSNLPPIPAGARISAPNLPDNTHVLTTEGNTLYTDQPAITRIPAGTALHLSWQTNTVSFSAAWTTAPQPGQPVGFWQQDDYKAFSEAAWQNERANGGAGARIFVPGGTYYLSRVVYTQNTTSFELAPGVRFIPGSASIDSTDGDAPANAQVSFLGSAHNKMPTTVNITQELYQRSVPDIQGQALLISQDNVNCRNDDSSWGCGMVGAEVKQGANKFVRRGAMWEYHGTDQLQPGQHIAWAGLEAEIANNSGWWGAWTGNSLNGNTIGLHIDNIASREGHVANSFALDPAGEWHTMAQCEGSILDWCIAHSDGLFSNQQQMQDSGIDSRGRVFGQQFYTMKTAPDSAVSGSISAGVTQAATRTAGISTEGQIGAVAVSTPVLENATSGLSGITIEDAGRFNAPVSLSIGRPPRGGRQARAVVGTYSLRAVQSGIAVNATDHSNAPDGVTAGMVFSLRGGQCETQPEVTYNGRVFNVTRPGSCTVLPDAITPEGMQRTVLTLAWASGGGGAPPTAPVIEPLYGIRSVRITDPGSGYNRYVLPDILAITSFSGSAWRGIIYTPVHLRAETAGTPPQQAPVRLAAVPAASLPSPCEPGQFAFVPDARNADEGPGRGTGSLAWCTTTRRWYASGMPLRK